MKNLVDTNSQGKIVGRFQFLKSNGVHEVNLCIHAYLGAVQKLCNAMGRGRGIENHNFCVT